jgi:asparagine synthase (glutamine-hydrolysing)
MIAADMATLLPDDYLVKVDRASMAHGLEVRPPLLDHELMELAARIPSNLKIHRGETKWVLKRACGDLLPRGALSRPKRGFEIPVDIWLRGPLRPMFEALVLDARAGGHELIDRATALRLYRAHLSGAGRYGGILWGLLVLACWTEAYLGPPRG